MSDGDASRVFRADNGDRKNKGTVKCREEERENKEKNKEKTVEEKEGRQRPAVEEKRRIKEQRPGGTGPLCVSCF